MRPKERSIPSTSNPLLRTGEPLINNPNLLREHKQVAQAALGNALQQYGVPEVCLWFRFRFRYEY